MKKAEFTKKLLLEQMKEEAIENERRLREEENPFLGVQSFSFEDFNKDTNKKYRKYKIAVIIKKIKHILGKFLGK